MNYISAEEFLKQNNKVKMILIDWWQQHIQIGDLFYWEDTFLEDFGEGFKRDIKINKPINVIDDKDIKEFGNKFIELFPEGTIIPLLQMHQLIQFIEDKKYYIEFNNFQNKKWTVDIYKSLMQTYSNYSITSDDLLKALWEVAVKIAEQEVEGY